MMLTHDWVGDGAGVDEEAASKAKGQDMSGRGERGNLARVLREQRWGVYLTLSIVRGGSIHLAPIVQ